MVLILSPLDKIHIPVRCFFMSKVSNEELKQLFFKGIWQKLIWDLYDNPPTRENVVLILTATILWKTKLHHVNGKYE
jgi:hypothetical protein